MDVSDDLEKSTSPVDPLEHSAEDTSPTEKELEVQSTKQPVRSLHSKRPISTHSTVVEEGEDVEDGRPDLTRVISPRRPPVKVPSSQRRGLFARFALVAEVENPYDYSDTSKWFITFTVAVAAAAAPLGSAIFFPSLWQVAGDLHTTETIANLSVALYMLAMAIFPLWWSAFSETSGRRNIYMASFALFVIFCSLSAISKSITMLVILRMLSGGAAASVQAVGAGTIADVWEPRERGRAMGIFYIGPLCGPLFAPIIGGLLAQRWNWRATLWFLAIYGFVTWIFIFFALPETLASRKKLTTTVTSTDVNADRTDNVARPTPSRTSSTRGTMHSKTKKYTQMARYFFIDPLKIILYLRFPAVFWTVYYASVTFGSLYVLNVSIQATFEKAPYRFKTWEVGLLYLPNSIGYVLASIFGGKWMDRIMAREAVRAKRFGSDGKLIYHPEDRMRENAWLGAMLYPAALIWYGWTAEKGVYWVVPMIANFFYGIGSMIIFAMATTMLTEFMPRKSSTGVAVNNFMRNIFSCVGAIVAAPIINAIGDGWLFTVLGIWALASSMVIWAMSTSGRRWRETMDRHMA